MSIFHLKQRGGEGEMLRGQQAGYGKQNEERFEGWEVGYGERRKEGGKGEKREINFQLAFPIMNVFLLKF